MFLLKMSWPKEESLNALVWFGSKSHAYGVLIITIQPSYRTICTGNLTVRENHLLITLIY